MSASTSDAAAAAACLPAKGRLRGRLLFLVNDAGFFLSHRLPLARAARAAGMEVHIATPADDASARIAAEGFAFHPVVMSRAGTRPWSEVRTFAAVVELLRSLAPDILHTVAIKPVLYGGLAARLVGCRALVSAIPGLGSVFTKGSLDTRLLRRLATWVYARALRHPRSRVIFQNPEDLRTFLDAAIVPPGEAVLIRGSGVDLARFRPSPLPAGMPIVMFASRMLWAKGVAEFVAAAERLTAQGVAARFVLVGEPDRGNPWCVPREKLQAWDRSGIVEWWGRREDMPEVMAQAYVFCLPSYYGEGLPKALIEAAACARPLVATDIPGCREAVRHNDNGLLVPVRDAERLADAIRSILEDRVRAETMGRRSREIAEREFGIESVVAQTLRLYEELLGSPASRVERLS